MEKRLKASLRAIGHNLQPVVTIGGQGLSQSVQQALEQALGDHELIKVRFPAGDRDARRALVDAAAVASDAEVIQTIGRVAVLYRAGATSRPPLSNLTRNGL